jgi:hypothetical protein
MALSFAIRVRNRHAAPLHLKRCQDSIMPRDVPKSRAPERESSGPATPFPRYERISERLADGRAGLPEERGEEIPRTESYGELWSRAARRTRRA